MDNGCLKRWEELTSLPKLLLSLGENLEREGLERTPERVRETWKEVLEGYTLTPEKVLERQFETTNWSWQICRNIHFVSMCEHHLLPFVGDVHIAYRPKTHVVGLSKLTRLVDCFARRLQIQERMTQEIATALYNFVHPAGVYVVASAVHLCCHGRGIRREAMSFITTAKCGEIPDYILPSLLTMGKE